LSLNEWNPVARSMKSEELESPGAKWVGHLMRTYYLTEIKRKNISA